MSAIRRVVKAHRFFCQASPLFVGQAEYRKGFPRAYVRFMWYTFRGV